MERQSFESDNAHWKQNLIFDNGKTNWKKFINTVEARLGSKPHYDTAREAWKNVPDKLKHNGRVREQEQTKRLLRINQVLVIVPISKSAWWEGCRAGRYPKPIKLGSRTTVWRAEDITAFIESLGKKGAHHE